MTETSSIRAAVIGVGAMGRHHARVYSELDATDLVGIADPDADGAAWVQRRHRVPAYSDYRELLERERPDIVSLAVPTQQHLPIALDVIASGAHLLIEKPIAASVEEARQIIDAAAGAERVLTVGHVERFNPAVVELRRRMLDGELGHVFTILARRMGPFPARVRDVGVVVDLATHDLDIISWIVGSPVERVYAETSRRIHTDHEDLLSGLLRFETGEIGVLNINWLTPTKIRELAVTGERGMFVADYLHQDLVFYENVAADRHWEDYGVLQGVGEGSMTRLRIDRREPLAAQLEAFAAAVKDGTPPAVSGADGLRALQLALELVASGRDNRVLDHAGSPKGSVSGAGQ
ncbi:MAG: Gfo/Idh/MocA family oxidoreductase [Anaerolineae bacterium]